MNTTLVPSTALCMYLLVLLQESVIQTNGRVVIASRVAHSISLAAQLARSIRAFTRFLPGQQTLFGRRWAHHCNALANPHKIHPDNPLVQDTPHKTNYPLYNNNLCQQGYTQLSITGVLVFSLSSFDGGGIYDYAYILLTLYNVQLQTQVLIYYFGYQWLLLTSPWTLIFIRMCLYNLLAFSLTLLNMQQQKGLRQFTLPSQ